MSTNKAEKVTGVGNVRREIRAATHAAVQPYIEALATACAQRDELLAALRQIENTHIADAQRIARAAIAKVEG